MGTVSAVDDKNKVLFVNVDLVNISDRNQLKDLIAHEGNHNKYDNL